MASPNEWLRMRERQGLTDDIRLFRRLNPPESDSTRIDQLPYSVRSALGNWRQWYVVSREQARWLRPDRDTRFFVERRGRWRAKGPQDRLVLGERWVAVRRMRVPESSGDCGAIPATQPAPQGGPPTIIYPIVESRHTGGDELRIRVLGRSGATPRTFTLTGSGRRVQRRVRAEDEHYVRFRGLQSGSRYTLQVGGTDLQTHDLIRDVPHAKLLEGGAGLRRYLEDHGLDATGYLLRHEKNSDGQVTLAVSVDPPQFGVFFDGTGNNLYNDMNREDRAPTNIGKLYTLHQEVHSPIVSQDYRPGVGTETGGRDNLIDQAVATSFGRRIKEAVEQTKQFAGEVALATLIIIDVFGFSRGAAQARAFINQVMALKRDEPEYFGGPEPVIRFVGLFDTVGSVGIPGNNSNHNAIAARGLSSPIDLTLAPDTVGQVLHLRAGDEMRANFPSSSLRTGPDAPLPDHFEEHELPGVHADIGGGYTDLPDIVYCPREVIRWKTEAERDRKVAAEVERLMAEHAKPGIRIEAETDEYLDYATPPEVNTSVAIFTWERDIDPSLAHYPLELMHQAAVDAGVPLKPLETLGRLGYAYEISDDLRELVEDAIQQGPGSPAHEALYQRYIHHSHQYGPPRSHEPGGGQLRDTANTNQPQTDATHTTRNGVRAVFYADTPEEASAEAASP